MNLSSPTETLAFSEDDSLVWVAPRTGGPIGEELAPNLVIYDTRTGARLKTLPTGPVRSLVVQADAVYILGMDSVVRVFAVPA